MKNNKSTDNGDEDFEIVGDLQILEERGQSAVSRFVPVGDTTDENVDVTDPFKTFELIHKEHCALKEELLAQQGIISKKLNSLKDEKITGEKKIGELNECINLLINEVNEKDARLISLEERMKSYKEASEKDDELCAKMLENEERLNYYEDLVNRMNLEKQKSGSDGTESFLTDANLAKEILENDTRLQTLQCEILDKESARLSLYEENLKLKEENKNLSDLISALQAQVEADQADMEDLKRTYELHKKSLNTDCQTLVRDVTTLNLSERRTHKQIFECERCKLRLPTAEIYQKHIIRCPLIVDSVF